EVKAVRWIHHPIALKQLKIVVHQHKIAGARLIEAETETQHPIGAGPVAARGDLAGKGGFVALGGENAAGERDLLAKGPGRHSEMTLHLLGGAGVILGLLTNDDVTHCLSPVIRASRQLALPALPISEFQPRRRPPARPGCHRSLPRLARVTDRGLPAT